MRYSKGCSFEVPGMWRKERVEAEDADYPESVGLTQDRRTLYVGCRLEQQLILLRWMGGNISYEQYLALRESLEAAAVAYLAPAPEPVAA